MNILDGTPNEVYEVLQSVFDFYNDELFETRLPNVLLSVDYKSRNSLGYCGYNFYEDKKTKQTIHTIGMIASHFDRSLKDIFSTLVHEMCHVERINAKHLKPPSGGYHDKAWAEMMLKVGLTPVSYDNPGKMTGNRVSHEIDIGGPFEVATQKLFDQKTVEVNILSRIKKKKKENKEYEPRRKKKVCPTCGFNAHVKPDSKIICLNCVPEEIIAEINLPLMTDVS